MTVDENFTDRHGRSCLVFSGVKKLPEVYDWLFSHYNGYKFVIMLDCSMSEHPEPESKIYVHFFDEVFEEAAMEAGYIKRGDTYVRR